MFGSESICWVCHDMDSTELPLLQPCKCKSMLVHRACLARWQLQQAGKIEERCCRFCHAELPDWREAHSQLPQAPPIMTVVHLGVTHQVRVEPGPDGRQRFQSEIRRIFNLNEHDPIQLTFGCRIPGSNQEIQLEGWESFDAAVYCAGISAGQRTRDSEGHTIGSKPVERRSSGASVLRRLFSRSSQNY